VRVVTSFSSWLSFDWFLLLVETLRRQVISSPTDIAEFSIDLLARDFFYLKGERLRRFKGRGVTGFFEFLALGIHKFALRFILHQVHFNFHF